MVTDEKSRYYIEERLSEHMGTTPEGFLIVSDVPIARIGEQTYRAEEVPITPNASGLVTIKRTEEEVFKSEAIKSYENKPFTIDHPKEMVTPENWSNYAHGVITNVRRGIGDLADFLMADITVFTQKAIEMIRGGMRQISCGYDAEYQELETGVGIQTSIIGNHIALVMKGRAGNRCAISDKECTGCGNCKCNKSIILNLDKEDDDVMKFKSKLKRVYSQLILDEDFQKLPEDDKAVKLAEVAVDLVKAAVAVVETGGAVEPAPILSQVDADGGENDKPLGNYKGFSLFQNDDKENPFYCTNAAGIEYEEKDLVSLKAKIDQETKDSKTKDSKRAAKDRKVKDEEGVVVESGGNDYSKLDSKIDRLIGIIEKFVESATSIEEAIEESDDNPDKENLEVEDPEKVDNGEKPEFQDEDPDIKAILENTEDIVEMEKKEAIACDSAWNDTAYRADLLYPGIRLVKPVKDHAKGIEKLRQRALKYALTNDSAISEMIDVKDVNKLTGKALQIAFKAASESMRERNNRSVRDSVIVDSGKIVSTIKSINQHNKEFWKKN